MKTSKNIYIFFLVKGNFMSMRLFYSHLLSRNLGFPGGSVVKNPSANAGDTGSIPGSGGSPGGVHGNPLQHSCLGNPMEREVWQATVHGVAKNRMGLSTHAALTGGI